MLKSTIVSSPAGSGKTQQLAERYIDLLKHSVPPERILTITFTEKAAAEMKERIFKLLKDRDPEMHQTLKEKSLRLRIQTIDSFCLSLLKRFAIPLGFQPDLEVLADPDSIWDNSMHDTLMTIAEKEKGSGDYELLVDLIVQDKFKGWPNLKKLFDNLFDKRSSVIRGKIPFKNLSELESLVEDINKNLITKELNPNYQIQLPKDFSEIEVIKSRLELVKNTFLTQQNVLRSEVKNPAKHNWYLLMYKYWRFIQNTSSNLRFKRIFDLFDKRFLTEYENRKKLTRQVDFQDLELKTYEAITTHPEWLNILYIFDENTDHILVDEFQDTSFLQWGIITKLAEEWLSGFGAKRERGIKPTMYLVGDDKQSIYLFRNAHSEIFEKAKAHLQSRLKPAELEIKQVEQNYRSLQSIIDFTNAIFPKIMDASNDAPAWVTRYKPFNKKRENNKPGIVQIILATLQGKITEAREKDGELVAQKILRLIDTPIVYDTKEAAQTCRYEDITILVRRRTHLINYENALRKHKIPFIVVKGIGFYNSPEIAIMRSLVKFLTDTTQDLDLYIILKSPLFGLSEKEILMVSQGIREDDKISLWDRLKAHAKTHNRYHTLIEQINEWVSLVGYHSIAEILENILDTQQAWRVFWESQRTVNIKKFLRIVEDLENQGAHPLMLCDYFEKKRNEEEAKANVNTEGRNEVKLMTIHAAKGLQFPVVFLVGLDLPFDKRGPETPQLIINEVDENNVFVSYEPDPNLRKLSPLYIEQQAKELEEEKRIFYVGVTRARDALFLTGVYNPDKIDKQPKSALQWLNRVLDIKQMADGNFGFSDITIPGFSIISESELTKEPITAQSTEEETALVKEISISPIVEQPQFEWQAVTRSLPFEWHRYGSELTSLGDILHNIFEKISKGKIQNEINEVISEAKRLFIIKNILASTQEKLLTEIKNQFELIKKSEIASIIQPQENSYAELPFVYKENKICFSGRIDRVIIKDNIINIYDYKTFPIQVKDLPDVIQKYKEQLAIYEKAASEIFSGIKTKTYLVFTAVGKIEPTN